MIIFILVCLDTAMHADWNLHVLRQNAVVQPSVPKAHKALLK